MRAFYPILLCVLVHTMLGSGVLRAQDTFGLGTLSEALDANVVTVTKQKERLFRTDAAVSVITRRDLERFGARSIRDALRLVPGFGVRQIDQSKTATRARNNYERFKNTVLVLVDGRNMFNETFYGQFWETTDIPIEEIERIEVLRGPSGNLWGVNAVDGVINIITRPPRETDNGELTGVLSHRGDYRGYVSKTFSLGENTHGRAFLHGRQAQDSDRGLAGEHRDNHSSHNVGVTLESTVSLQDLVRLDVGFSQSMADEIHFRPILDEPFTEVARTDLELGGSHIQAEWDHHINASTFSKVRAYALWSSVEADYAKFDESKLDVEWTLNAKVARRHRLNLGLGVQQFWSEADARRLIRFADPSREITSFNGFLQDRIELIEDTFWLTLGSKLEYNDQIDAQFQPSVRALYSPREKLSVWGALTSSVRTPSRLEFEDSVQILSAILPAGTVAPDTPVTVQTINGNSDFEEENFLTYELGARSLVGECILLDAALHYTEIENLRNLEMGTPFPREFEGATVLELPTTVVNADDATTYGFELDAKLALSDNWRLGGNYAYLNTDIEADFLRSDGITAFPEHEFLVHLGYDSNKKWAADAWFEFSDDPVGPTEEATSLRLRGSYRATPRMRFSLIAQNLLQDGDITYDGGENQIVPLVPAEAETTILLEAHYEF